jgi:hypothetical protein
MEVLKLERPRLELTQVVELLPVEMFSCPQRGHLGDLIEPLDLLNACHYFVVIASDYILAMRSRPFEHFRGTRIVSDNVAAANDLLKVAACVREYRIKCIRISVNIAEYQKAHKRINVISGGAPVRTGISIVPRPDLRRTENRPEF